MGITCGVDWAEAHHDVALLDEQGAAGARQDRHRRNRIQRAVGLIAEHGGSPEDPPIAIETDKNLLVTALAGAGFTVYPINPRAVARYRERYGQAGGKSDPGDALVLADILRTDRHRHRPLPRSASRAARSRRWPASTRRRSGRLTRPSAACGRCCWSSIRKRCTRFRTSSTRPRSPSSPRRRPPPLRRS